MYVIRVKFPDGWMWLTKTGATPKQRHALAHASQRRCINDLVERCDWLQNCGAHAFIVERKEA